MAKPKIIGVVGPTASGKTDYAIRLAKERGGEVVSCDSMQIYRHMDIGTAKPTSGGDAGDPPPYDRYCEAGGEFQRGKVREAGAGVH